MVRYFGTETWSGIEVVITGLTRNQLYGNVPWVRIPPAPPFSGMWLSLVEHYVRDVGAAGSNPVIPTTLNLSNQTVSEVFALSKKVSKKRF